jgi:hypothetical protein
VKLRCTRSALAGLDDAVSSYPYLIFYEVAADQITVHAIRHPSRDPASIPGH